MNVKWIMGDALNTIQSMLRYEQRRQYRELKVSKGIDYGRIFLEIMDRSLVRIWFVDVRRSNRILTGHVFCAETLHKMGVKPFPNCNVCEVPENSSQVKILPVPVTLIKEMHFLSYSDL